MNARRQANPVRRVGMAWMLWLGCLAGLLMPPATRAYVLEGYHWTANKPIVLDLQLGAPKEILIDGSTSWNQVAEAAMAVWNPSLGSGVQFEERDDSATPEERDGKNEVFFSKTLYGESFGDDTLATTLSFFNTTTKIKDEADVVFNSAVDFDSYRGDLRVNGEGEGAYDLRRVAIHEFGHVLGLEHVPQDADSIMTPDTTNIDTIQADDIAGVKAIYGDLLDPPVITSAPSASATLNGQFTYQTTATGSNITYTADGLPGGVGINSQTGFIGGVFFTAGTYHVLITATNFAGIDTETLIITVITVPQITSTLSATGQLGQFFLYQITAASGPTNFDASSLPAGLVVDASTGLISGTPTVFGLFSVDISATNAAGRSANFLTLKILPDNAVSILYSFDPATAGGGPGNSLIQGADSNFYGTTAPNDAAAYRLTPTGTVTFLHTFTAEGGTTAPSPLIQATDGNFYGVSSRDGNYGAGAVFRMAPDGTVTTLYSFQQATGGVPTAALVQGNDGNFYGTTTTEGPYALNAGTIFRITPDGALTVLHAFADELAAPSALIQAADGNFYGVSAGGGDFFQGAIFRMTPDGAVTILHSFDGTDGYTPQGPLLPGRDGNFYGVTENGPGYVPAATSTGSVFRMTPGGVVTTIHAFSGQEGVQPSALTSGQDGNFYGVTNCILYRLTPDGALTLLHTFTINDGLTHTALTQARDGSFYGAETSEGAGVVNAIYKTTFGEPPITANVPPVVLSVTRPKVTVGSGGNGQFTVSVPSAQVTDVVVFYTVKGDALDSTDFAHLNGSVTIKAGAVSAAIKIKPEGDLRGVGKRTVRLALTPEPSYTLDGLAVGKVKILVHD